MHIYAKEVDSDELWEIFQSGILYEIVRIVQKPWGLSFMLHYGFVLPWETDMTSNVLQFNKEEETMEGKILDFTRTAGSGPIDGANYLKDMKEGCVFQVVVRRNDTNYATYMFEVARHYEKSTMLAQFDPASQQHAYALVHQDRFCKHFELVSIVSDGKEEEENEHLDGPG